MGNNQECAMFLPENPKGTQNLFVLEFIANSVNLRARYSVLRAVSDFTALFGCDSI